MAARLPAALLLLLLAAPAALATYTTVTGTVYCDVDKSDSVNAPPDTPAKGALVKIVCITSPNTTLTRYAVTDVNGAYIFNRTIPTVNSTGGKFMGCIATLVNTTDATCALPGPCNDGDKGEPVKNANGGTELYYPVTYSVPPFCFEPTP
eukprot:SM005244S17851  [mRNA]  locus=s5244:9:1059:+ [translate_table: standard]